MARFPDPVRVFSILTLLLPAWASLLPAQVMPPQAPTFEKGEQPYHPSAVEAFNAGHDRYREGKKKEAAELYRKALGREPGMKPALRNLAILYVELEDLTAAESTVRNWAAAEPESADVYQVESNLAFKKRDFGRARDLLKKALSLEQDTARKEAIEKNLASLESYFLQAAERDKDVEPSMNLDSGGQGAGMAQTERLERSGSVLEARQRTQEALNRASEAMAKGELAAAIAILEPALAQVQLNDQQRLPVLTMLAHSHFQLKQWPESKKYVQEILTLDPGDPDARGLLKELESLAP